MDRRVRRRPQRVLVVDDAADLRLLWRTYLTIWGFAVAEAQNGREAVEQAIAFQPDLILMDIAMPVLDGLSATALLRDHPTTAAVPIVALSANGLISTADALEVGCDTFVGKPVAPEALLEAVRATLRSGSPVPRATAAGPDPAG